MIGGVVLAGGGSITVFCNAEAARSFVEQRGAASVDPTPRLVLSYLHARFVRRSNLVLIEPRRDRRLEAAFARLR